MSQFKVVKVKDTPTAVVLIFGWLGAPLRHVNKYAQIYNSRGCSTVTSVADSLEIMVSNKKQLEGYAHLAAMEAAVLVVKLFQCTYLAMEEPCCWNNWRC
jgi:hypothetical protein